MYYALGCFLVIIFFFILFFHMRKKKICKKICRMSQEEKCHTLCNLTEPFGYCYVPSQDIFSTTIHAPQRLFGYTALFDRYAAHFNMAIDCMPVYFDYQGSTWLIECWKGQYGINMGCEVGIYKADSLVPSIWQKTTLFHSVEDDQMLPVSIRFYHKENAVACLAKKHWWLTVFVMGSYGEPKDLQADIGITFPNTEMLAAFSNALGKQWDVEYDICGMQVLIHYDVCTSCNLAYPEKFFFRFSQWRNRILCRLFLWMTKPFCLNVDRLLYLYEFLPSLFRRMFADKNRKKCCKKSCKKCGKI